MNKSMGTLITALLILLLAGLAMCSTPGPASVQADDVVKDAIVMEQASSASADFCIHNTSGDYGATISVPINVSSITNIGATDIVLLYDPSMLTIVSVDAGALASGVLVITDTTIDPINGTISDDDNLAISSCGALASNATSDELNISIISEHGINGTDSLVVIEFLVKGGYGIESPLTLSTVVACDLNDPFYNESTGDLAGFAEVEVTKISGIFTATGVITGDVNADQRVSLLDLVMLGSTYGLSLGDSGYIAAADLSGNDEVSLLDLVMLGAHYGETIE